MSVQRFLPCQQVTVKKSAPAHIRNIVGDVVGVITSVHHALTDVEVAQGWKSESAYVAVDFKWTTPEGTVRVTIWFDPMVAEKHLELVP